MAYRLSFEEGGRPRNLTLRAADLSIGRDPECDVHLSDRSVSRDHARLTWDGARWMLEDRGSTNRTQINSLYLEPGPSGARPVNEGDRLSFGGVSAELYRVEGALSDEVMTADEVYTSVTDLRSAREPLTGELTAATERRPAGDVFEVLAALGQRLVAIKPLGEILDGIVELVLEATAAERAAVLLWDEASGSLVPRVLRSSREDAKADALPISRSIVERAFHERSVVQVNRRGSGTGSMWTLDLGSALAVPLWSEDSVLGTVYADVSSRSPPFEPRGVALISVVANYAAMAIQQNRLLARVQDEERRRQRLEGYFSEAVVQEILRSPGGEDFACAQECDVTVLFCDMVGFTALSEGLSPHAVLSLLNRYFGRMAESIFGHEGTLDKFIGDCIMCVFGAPLPQPDHARRAALAALDLRQAVRQLASGSTEAVSFRIGLNSGPAVAGNLGHARRREWTVLGPTVNLASRVESSVAKPGQIVLTEFTRRCLGNDFELKKLPPQSLKGISREIAMYQLIGFKKR